MYDSLNMKFNEDLYTKLFSNLLSDHDYIMINLKDTVQQQANAYDCGVHSLAFLISLYKKEDP